MEDFQKEFLHIKKLINSRDQVFLGGQELPVIDISKDLQEKIKRFWNTQSVEDQVAMFLDRNDVGSREVTRAMHSFGQRYFAAKADPSRLNPIDKVIAEKTYYTSEELPGFEGRLYMTQLFCNGREANGAYRMHNFFYLLPSSDFENESGKTDDVPIGDFLGNIDNVKGSKDAMYCLTLIREVYGKIKLKYFKRGVFLGDYLPDNLWSAWRYMNCRELTIGETRIIPLNLYSTFVDNAFQYFGSFAKKIPPCILTELWKTNISISIYSTLFENNILLRFFQKNPKIGSRYGLSSFAQPPALTKKTGSQCVSSEDNSSSMSVSDNPKKTQTKETKSEKKISTKSGCTCNSYSEKSDGYCSYHSSCSSSLSNQTLSFNRSQDQDEGAFISLKKRKRKHTKKSNHEGRMKTGNSTNSGFISSQLGNKAEKQAFSVDPHNMMMFCGNNFMMMNRQLQQYGFQNIANEQYRQLITGCGAGFGQGFAPAHFMQPGLSPYPQSQGPLGTEQKYFLVRQKVNWALRMISMTNSPEDTSILSLFASLQTNQVRQQVEMHPDPNCQPLFGNNPQIGNWDMWWPPHQGTKVYNANCHSSLLSSDNSDLSLKGSSNTMSNQMNKQGKSTIKKHFRLMAAGRDAQVQQPEEKEIITGSEFKDLIAMRIVRVVPNKIELFGSSNHPKVDASTVPPRFRKHYQQ